MLNRSANRMFTLRAAAAACLLALCSPAVAASQPAEPAPLPAAPAPLPDREALAEALNVRDFSHHLVEPFVNELGGVEIAFEFRGGDYDLYLWPHSVRAPDYRLLICGGAGQLVEADPPTPATYRGHVEQAGASRIAATLRDGQINAMILLEGRAEPPDRVLFIQPLSDIVPGAPAAAHIIYTASDTLSHGMRCSAGLVPPGHAAGDGGGTDSGPPGR